MPAPVSVRESVVVSATTSFVIPVIVLNTSCASVPVMVRISSTTSVVTIPAPSILIARPEVAVLSSPCIVLNSFVVEPSTSVASKVIVSPTSE